MAGGVPEARQYLKEKIRYFKSYMMPLAFFFSICLALVGSELHEWYRKYRIRRVANEVRD